jgi:uncharacterized coiled-coil DUF342 family protein
MNAAVNLQPELSPDDPLASLEERIRRTVEVVATLRAERDAAIAELESARRAAGAARAETQGLREEVQSLRAERKQVRVRIEKLLGQVDLVGIA